MQGYVRTGELMVLQCHRPEYSRKGDGCRTPKRNFVTGLLADWKDQGLARANARAEG